MIMIARRCAHCIWRRRAAYSLRCHCILAVCLQLYFLIPYLAGVFFSNGKARNDGAYGSYLLVSYGFSLLLNGACFIKISARQAVCILRSARAIFFFSLHTHKHTVSVSLVYFVGFSIILHIAYTSNSFPSNANRIYDILRLPVSEELHWACIDYTESSVIISNFLVHIVRAVYLIRRRSHTIAIIKIRLERAMRTLLNDLAIVFQSVLCLFFSWPFINYVTLLLSCVLLCFLSLSLSPYVGK